MFLGLFGAWPQCGAIIQDLWMVTEPASQKTTGSFISLRSFSSIQTPKEEARLIKQLSTLENLSHWQS